MTNVVKSMKARGTTKTNDANPKKTISWKRKAPSSSSDAVVKKKAKGEGASWKSPHKHPQTARGVKDATTSRKWWTYGQQATVYRPLRKTDVSNTLSPVSEESDGGQKCNPADFNTSLNPVPPALGTVAPRSVGTIAIEDIVVPEGRRRHAPEDVEEMAASIADYGLYYPVICVLTEAAGATVPHTATICIDGYLRVEGMKTLGRTHIDVTYIQGDQTDTRICQLVTALHRNELPALDRAEYEAELFRLTQARLLVSGQKVQKIGRGRPEGGIAQVARALPGARKTEAAKRKSQERSLLIDGLSPVAKDLARELDANRSQLLEAAKESTPEGQIAKLQKAAAQKRAPGSKKSARRKAADDLALTPPDSAEAIDDDIDIPDFLDRRPHAAARAADRAEFTSLKKLMWDEAPGVQRAWKEASQGPCEDMLAFLRSARAAPKG